MCMCCFFRGKTLPLGLNKVFIRSFFPATTLLCTQNAHNHTQILDIYTHGLGNGHKFTAYTVWLLGMKEAFCHYHCNQRNIDSHLYQVIFGLWSLSGLRAPLLSYVPLWKPKAGAAHLPHLPASMPVDGKAIGRELSSHFPHLLSQSTK